MYDRMLVPLDGSELAEEVSPYIAELAAKMGVSVALLFVCTHSACEFKPAHQAYIEEAARDIEREARRIQDSPGPPGKDIRITAEVVEGNPADEILRYADEHGSDLIAIATHGRSGIKRWVMGSVAQKVLGAAKCPVYLIRPRSEGKGSQTPWTTATIIVPLDGSELAESVVPFVTDLASGTKAKVLLLQVVPDTYEVHTRGGRAARVKYTSGHMKEVIAQSQEYLEGVARILALGLPDDKVATEVRPGQAAEAIIEAAQSAPGTIVAMSTHGRSGLSRWAYGSIADKVLNGTSTPVLLVKCPGACEV